MTDQEALGESLANDKFIIRCKTVLNALKSTLETISTYNVPGIGFELNYPFGGDSIKYYVHVVHSISGEWNISIKDDTDFVEANWEKLENFQFDISALAMQIKAFKRWMRL